MHHTQYYHSSLTAGGGKSHTTYTNIAKSGDKTIIVVPRIDLIEEQLALFNGKAIAIHSRDGSSKSVVEKIVDAIAVIQDINNDKQVLVITHKGFLQYNRWGDIAPVWNLVIDEQMDFFELVTLKSKLSSNTDEFWGLFESDNTHSGYTEVSISSKGKMMFKERVDVWYESPNLYNLYMRSHNSWIALKEGKFGCAADEVNFITLTDFSIFDNFLSITILADGFINSPLCKYIETAHNIEFKDLKIKAHKQRCKQINERVTIYQLTEENISGYLMNKLGPTQFNDINFTINQLVTERNTIWSTNAKYKKQLNINGTYLSPKQSGTNAYSDKTDVVWLASMKTHKEHNKLAKEFINFDNDTLTELKELEPMHQFITRSNIRDYDSTQHITIIVFGPQQAAYLAKRYGINGSEIKHLHVDLGLPTKKTVGRKASTLTRAERAKIKRCRDAIKANKPLKANIEKWFIDITKE